MPVNIGWNGFVQRTQTTNETNISSEQKLPKDPPQPQASNPTPFGSAQLG